MSIIGPGISGLGRKPGGKLSSFGPEMSIIGSGIIMGGLILDTTDLDFLFSVLFITNIELFWQLSLKTLKCSEVSILPL